MASGSGWDPALGDVYLFASVEDWSNLSNAFTSVPVDRSGEVSPTRVTIPFYDVGDYALAACQNCGDVDYSPGTTFPFSIVERPPPAFTIEPSSAYLGQSVEAWGTGWEPAFGEVRIFTDSAAVADPAAVPLAVAPVDDLGRFGPTPVTLFGLAATSYSFVACQRCGDPDITPSATFDFTVLTRGSSGASTPAQTSGPSIAAPTSGATGGRDWTVAILVLLVIVLAGFAGVLLARRGRRPPRPKPDGSIVRMSARQLEGSVDLSRAEAGVDVSVRLVPTARTEDSILEEGSAT
jgi:hypothetical protein